MIDIPNYSTFTKVEAINKGWSKDKKYYVETTSGQKLLLRLSDISEYKKKKEEYEAVIVASRLGIQMSKPIDFGVCNGGSQVYMLLTWIEGEDVEIVITTLSEREQYQMGLQAGKMLKKIHCIIASDGQPNQESRIRYKVAVKLSQYKTCGHKVPNDHEILRFIEQNLYCLKDSEYVMLHGDFHVGNLITDNNHNLGVIDFNRFDYGDPFEDFNRLMVFSRRISIPFAKGQISGYFNGEHPPELFFRRMALYTAMNALFSIVWSIPYGEVEIEGSLERSKMNYDDYRGFTTIVPIWYEGS